MRSRAKQGQINRLIARWPSERGNKRREKVEDAAIESREQIRLTNWQTHQWERACNAAPKIRKGKKLLRPNLDRYPFSKMEKRAAP